MALLIVPLPGELERASQDAQAEIGEKLKESVPDNVPVLFGTV